MVKVPILSAHVNDLHRHYCCLYVDPRFCRCCWQRYERVQAQPSSSSWVELSNPRVLLVPSWIADDPLPIVASAQT